MLRKLNLSYVKPDLFSVVAVLLNCIFINVYSYEYEVKNADLILNASVIAYAFCIACTVGYYMRSYISEKKICIIWIVCLTYCIGFLPIYTVLITGGKKYLLLNLSSSLLLLAMMTDWFIFMNVSFFGISIAFIVFFMNNQHQQIDLLQTSKKTYFIYYIMSYTFIAVSLFMKKKERVQEKRMDFMKVFGSAIAHEVNSPLASMRMMTDVLDSIIESMKVKKRAGEYILTINEMDYEMLTCTIRDGMKKSANDAIQIVEMLLAAIREKYTNHQATSQMSSIVTDAITLANHLDTTCSRISLKIESDFQISGNIKLLKHVIYNLIKNSFKHGGANVEVLIEIYDHKVIVSDNGIGIPADKIGKIFGAFFTDGNGTGIGLAFAKFVLDDMNASIGCESQVRKYTKFTIKFNNF